MRKPLLLRTLLVVTSLGLVAIAAVGITAWQRADDPVTAIARGQYGVAAELLAVDARQNDADALTRLGNLYYLGLGVDADPRRAAELYHRAAAAGHAPAQLNLAHLYSQGLGVERDIMRAFGWYRMADRYGSPAAEYYLSQITVEWTLSPMQIVTARERWPKLATIVAEAL